MTLRYLGIRASHPLAALPALSVELFQYQGAAKDGDTLEYVFEAGDQNSPDDVTKEKAPEIAANFMTGFITYRSEHWKRRNFGQAHSVWLMNAGAARSQHFSSFSGAWRTISRHDESLKTRCSPLEITSERT
jgi:hypothetical protein